MSELIKSIEDQQFEAEVLQATTPVLVDFWAPWCGPCKRIAPILEEIAAEYGARLKIVKVNVDDNQESPAKYNVRGIPNLILFKDGNAVANKVGSLGKSQLSEFLNEFV